MPFPGRFNPPNVSVVVWAVALPANTPITPRPVTDSVPNVSAEFADVFPSSCRVLELRVGVGAVAVFSRVSTPARVERGRS